MQKKYTIDLGSGDDKGCLSGHEFIRCMTIHGLN